MQKFTIALGFSLLVSACSTLEFPGVYRLAIEQGNIITQEMVDQLEPGMSREQVQFVLGTALVQDTFNADRWDYVYNIREGSDLMRQYRLTVFFEGEQLSHFTGDFVPTGTTKGATP